MPSWDLHSSGQVTSLGKWSSNRSLKRCGMEPVWGVHPQEYSLRSTSSGQVTSLRVQSEEYILRMYMASRGGARKSRGQEARMCLKWSRGSTESSMARMERGKGEEQTAKSQGLWSFFLSELCWEQRCQCGPTASFLGWLWCGWAENRLKGGGAGGRGVAE